MTVGRKATGTGASASGAPGAIPTERGRRTRAALVVAAKRVFERDGYLEARISDISKTAKVAHGTFYTYFTSKEEIFREVITAVQAELLAGQARDNRQTVDRGVTSDEDPIGRIEAANRAYLAGYRQNAKLLGLMEQVSTFNDDLRRMRLDMRQAFVTRAARAITRWQAAGRADPTLDPWYAANALCNMVDRFAYTWLVLGEYFEEERAVVNLTRLWAHALQLEPTAATSRL
ncbi:MAG: TetR/AcrR family transcriptional regulator [Acidimicrobiales bacterium]